MGWAEGGWRLFLGNFAAKKNNEKGEVANASRKCELRCGDVARLEECLPRTQEALGSFISHHIKLAF